MPSANITRRATAKGIATATVAPIYVDSDDNSLKVLPAGSGSTAEHLVQTSGPGASVTQASSITTGVTINAQRGQITTVASTLAAGSEAEFTVTNSSVAATDVICLSTTYAGAGTPALSVKGVASGSFVIVITNLHAANALDAVLAINFVVLKGATS